MGSERISAGFLLRFLAHNFVTCRDITKLFRRKLFSVLRSTTLVMDNLLVFVIHATFNTYNTVCCRRPIHANEKRKHFFFSSINLGWWQKVILIQDFSSFPRSSTPNFCYKKILYIFIISCLCLLLFCHSFSFVSLHRYRPVFL